jgi:GNAT superfamily N-acetyltransferase
VYYIKIMAVNLRLVELPHPIADPDLSSQAAELILEIGNYKKTRDVPQILGEMAGRTTIVALDGYEQVIGTSGVRIITPGLALLEDVVSDPRKTRLGIGRQVVEAAEDVASRQGVVELNLASTQLAIPFYAALSYQQLSDRFFRKFL